MKIQHKPPTEYRSATLTPEYQAEVDASMARGKARWDHEQAELAKAERRRERLARRKPKTAREAKLTRHKLRMLDEWIELERARLRELRGIMQASPQSATHRGVKSYRNVPSAGELL